MNTIYFSASTSGRQHNNATLVAEIAGKRYRAQIHWDASYDFQTHADVAVLNNGEFRTLVDFRHSELELIHEAQSSSDGVGYGKDAVEYRKDLMHKQAVKMITIGASIAG